jgi:hypothetical protein
MCVEINSTASACVSTAAYGMVSGSLVVCDGMRLGDYRIRRLRVRMRRLLHYWPWLASAAIHLAALIVLSAIVFISFEAKTDRPEIIPDARLGSVTGQAMPLVATPQQVVTDLSESLMNKQLEQQFKPNVPNSTSADHLDIIAAPAMRTSDDSVVSVQASAASAPKTRFFGATGNAYSVVYVVDISPSMLVVLKPLKTELKRCLDDLKPMQKFHVLFFSSGAPVEGPAKGLTWASDRNKRHYAEFIDKVDTDVKTDPSQAIKRALDLNPDLIYLLTDGVFDRRLVDQIIEWSKARKIKLNTIAYVNEQGASALRQIAEETGGVYRFVSEGHLQWE